MLQTDTLADTYREQGFVIVPKLYTDAEIIEWKREVLEWMADCADPSGVRVWMCETMPDIFRDRFVADPIASVVKAILGPDVEFLSAKPVYKSKAVSFGSPWHQDYAYWHGINKLSAWVALDDATIENGCLKVAPRAHDRFHEHEQHVTKEGFGMRLPASVVASMDTIDVPLKRGDAIFFSDWLPHASNPNTSGQDRWSFIPTYRAANAGDTSTVWKSTIRI